MHIDKKIVTVAFPTDEHVPFQDDYAREVAMQIVDDFDPDVLISGSDGMDFYTVSSFRRDPARMKGSNLQDEISMRLKIQAEWRSTAPNARTIWIPGNHDDRWERYLWDHPEIYHLEALKMENLLMFDKYGIEKSDYEVVINNTLSIRHGVRYSKHAAYAAKNELFDEKYAISLFMGHTHKGGVHWARTRRGPIQGRECFCLCDLDPEYVRNPNWQQGIVLATVVENEIYPEPVPFFRRRGRVVARWRGKEYTS